MLEQPTLSKCLLIRRPAQEQIIRQIYIHLNINTNFYGFDKVDKKD